MLACKVFFLNLANVNYEEVDRIGRIPNDWTDCENDSEAIALFTDIKEGGNADGKTDDGS